MILRKKTYDDMRTNPVSFYKSVEYGPTSCPPALEYFSRWLLSGNRNRKLGDPMETHVDILAKTTSSFIMNNIKTDRQVLYKPKNDESYRPRHSYTPLHTIGMGLALRSYDRINAVLDLLSAPNYGITITSCSCLQWETVIANTI